VFKKITVVKYVIAISFLSLLSCKNSKPSRLLSNEKSVKKQINEVLDHWHKAAAEADFKTYFDLLADDAVFVGTDSSEVWHKQSFIQFAKPYFDKGKAWNFKKIKRQVYLSTDFKTAWFDETLDTWMGVCRGSGVLQKTGSTWRIKHYVLSLTVPNNKMQKVIKVIQN